MAGQRPAPRMVVVSVDGNLGKFPLGAMPGKKPGSYLLEEYMLAFVPAAEVMVHSRLQVQGSKVAGAADGTRSVPATKVPATKTGNVLVVADVDYERRGTAATPEKPKRLFAARAVRDEADAPFARLDGTRGELATIQKLYRDNFGIEGLTTLESVAATREAFVREGPRHHYLHVATHGYFAAERFSSALARSPQGLRESAQGFVTNQSLAGYHPGLLSGLALAGANHPSDEDDGIVTAEEVGSLNLSGVELAVLSACETGLGQAAGGEGLLGLQRAFHAAGTRTVIASLWKVDDVATRDLMERFYDNLWNKNMGKLEALREAQLWMLKERGPRGLVEFEGDKKQGAGDSRRLPPYFWAAWVLSGDWR